MNLPSKKPYYKEENNPFLYAIEELLFQKILPKKKPVLLLLQYGPKDAREETLTLINVGFLYSQCHFSDCFRQV